MLRKSIAAVLAVVLGLGVIFGIKLTTGAKTAADDSASHTLSTDDTLAAYQWALCNDGAFTAEEYQSAPSHGPHRGSGKSVHRGERFSRRSERGGTRKTETASTAGIDVGVETAWAAYNGGERDVVVALIDSGVDASHEDLQNILWTNPGEIAENGIDDDGNGYVDDVNGWNFCNDSNEVTTDEDGHGTHSAGSMLANTDNGVGILQRDDV